MTLRTTHDVADAVTVLRAGGLVALPTETVYGLAGDASSPGAVARIFQVKGRPSTHPVIVHLPSASHVDAWAVDVPDWARTLMTQLWPGPLTLIVPRTSTVLDAVTGGQLTVGLRVPAHPLTLQLLERFDGGLAAPSANRYGHVSPTTAQHVADQLGEFLDADRDLVLDGGHCPVGVESTIIGAWDDTPRLLRPGAVTPEQITDITGRVVSADGAGVRAPGTTALHYAPRARVVIVEPEALSDAIAGLADGERVGVIAPAGAVVAPDVERLAAPADENEYAQGLYAALHLADESGMDVVIAVPPPARGVGVAVRDRLNRASTERTTR
ncbi:MAG: L-threonylcarbamoyladenylate synthase [Actinomycetes bacterium]